VDECKPLIFGKTSRTNARGEAEIALLDKNLIVGLSLLPRDVPA
jgi:hypothetical protein